MQTQKHPVMPGVFFGGQRMLRRYRFEFILALLIVCGLITIGFWLY